MDGGQTDIITENAKKKKEPLSVRELNVKPLPHSPSPPLGEFVSAPSLTEVLALSLSLSPSLKHCLSTVDKSGDQQGLLIAAVSKGWTGDGLTFTDRASIGYRGDCLAQRLPNHCWVYLMVSQFALVL